MEGQHKIIVSFTIHSETKASIGIDGLHNAVACEVELKDGFISCSYKRPKELMMQEKCAITDLHVQLGEFVDMFMMGMEPALGAMGLTMADCGVKVDCKVCCPDTVH